jgi:protein SCO1/2
MASRGAGQPGKQISGGLAGALAAGVFVALAAVPAPALAQTTDQLQRQVAAIGVTERLGAAVPRGATLTDSAGNPLTLAALAGRPVLLSFNYTGCPRLCGLQLSGLARALRDLGWDGERFAVVSVSIDPAERLPQLATYKLAKVREAGGRPGAAQGWRFLTGSQADVAALAEAVGFRYRYQPTTGEYQHQATLVVLTGEGRVSGYLHGITYPAAALREALARAEQGEVATASQQQSIGGFLLSCMGYDPADHSPLALQVMRGGGVLALLFLLSLLVTLALRGAQRRRLQGRST